MPTVANHRYRLKTAALVCVCLLSVSACVNQKTAGNFSLLTRPTLIAITTIGRIDVTAQCHSGEQLVGGGYVLPDPLLDAPTNLIVEASYPSLSPDQWNVTLFNPDDDVDGPNRGALIRVDAYCLATPSFVAGMQVVASGPETAAFDQVTEITADCPAGSAVTGGGFKTDHTQAYAGLYNAWLLASAPALDASERATGWRVEQYVISWPTPPARPKTTVYALCATQNLTANPPASGEVLPVDDLGFTYYAGQAVCAEDEFTTGGGYEFLGDRLVPHLIYKNAAVDKFAAWEAKGVYGHQPGEGADVSVWALCIQLPRIDLAVRITTPIDGSFLPVAPEGGQTEPVTFTAVATDASGAPASGVTFQWTDNGVVFGTAGATFTAVLDAAGCEDFIYHQIMVTATDGAGHVAADAIEVRAGQVC